MERKEDSQDTSGNADGFGDRSRASQSRPQLDFSIPGFSLFTQTPHEYFFFWQRSNAADQGRDDQAARVNPEREGEDAVLNGQTATAEDQESTEGSCRRESNDNVGDDQRARVDSKQEGENAVPNGQIVMVEDPEVADGSHRRESDDVYVGEIIIISHPSKARESSELPEEVSTASTDGRNEESTARSHGQKRDDLNFTVDSTESSLTEWPLLGSNRGMRHQRRRSSRKPSTS
ncbi:hypothetical protein ACJRO7_033783 [Eucalyptus globulus]|uniref:Uncharacterized protein n=1 Tax=Eucalyptus globulus TaxID=34317 RepID=A0ABD3J4E3_EUCGL